MKSRYLGLIFALAMVVLFASCGSGTTTSGGNTPVTGFHVTGNLSSSQSPFLSAYLKDGGSAEDVTDVIAVAPTATGVTCATAEVGADGSFDVEISPDQIWGLFFVNRQTSGSSMFLAWYFDQLMHSLSPNKTDGTVALETVTIDSSAESATSSVDQTEILSDLDIDTTTAETIGAQDQVLSRYSNPDIDNDGTIDCTNSTEKFIFDFHIRYDAKINGTKATINDLLNAFFSETATTFQYSSTGVYVAYPTSYSSAATGTVTFENTDVTTERDGAVAAGTAISDTIDNSFSGYYGYGTNLISTSELPSGTVKFEFNGKILTFSNVETPTLVQLNAAVDRIFPFIKITTTDSSCTNNCAVSNISYKWMKRTDSGWTNASATEIEMLVASGGGGFSFYVSNDAGKYVHMAIPGSATSGTIEWTAANVSLTGVTAAEFAAITTGQICNIGLSYDDQLGMRYFENIDDTCD